MHQYTAKYPTNQASPSVPSGLVQPGNSNTRTWHAADLISFLRFPCTTRLCLSTNSSTVEPESDVHSMARGRNARQTTQQKGAVRLRRNQGIKRPGHECSRMLDGETDDRLSHDGGLGVSHAVCPQMQARGNAGRAWIMTVGKEQLH